MKDKLKKFWEENRETIIDLSVGATVSILVTVIGTTIRDLRAGQMYSADVITNKDGDYAILMYRRDGNKELWTFDKKPFKFDEPQLMRSSTQDSEPMTST